MNKDEFLKAVAETGYNVGFGAKKHFSTYDIVEGIIGLYISLYDSKKTEYEKSGIALTKIYNEIGNLYRKAKSVDGAEIADLEIRLSELQSEYYSVCQSKQILFSDWYAHYKFF